MKTYRIVYRQEVYIDASSRQEAQRIFDNLNLDDLQNELGNGIINHTSFIEEVSFEEYEKNN